MDEKKRAALLKEAEAMESMAKKFRAQAEALETPLLLSVKTQVALDAFASAAQNWGSQQDCGSGAKARSAETAYDATLLCLRKRLYQLEQRAKKQK